MMVSFSLILQSCNVERLVSEEKLSVAEDTIEFILNANYQSLKNKSVDGLKEKMTPNIVNEVRALVPKEKPLSVNLVGFQQNRFSSSQTSSVVESYTFQYEFSDKWLLISFVTQAKDGNEPLFVGFNVNPIAGDLKELNKFNLIGQPLQNYIALIFSIAVFVFILVSLFMCYKTSIPKRKWLWYVFITFGFFATQLNWTTGQFNVQFLSLQFFGSGFVKASVYAPAIIISSIPIGAIVFHLKRRKWIKS